MSTVAIIPARGGSKGIHKKNLVNVCGRPLVEWSVLQALNSKKVDRVVVSSDSEEILHVAKTIGAEVLKRPDCISGDFATTEEALQNVFQSKSFENVEKVVLLQPTSPLRKKSDIDNALSVFEEGNYDSLFSAAELEDFLLWEHSATGYKALNYDFTSRGRRQDREKQLVENGSIYIFRPEAIMKHQNRLYGNIGVYLMHFWQTFEIDAVEDIFLIETLFKGYLQSE